jgi:hypothetical protein
MSISPSYGSALARRSVFHLMALVVIFIGSVAFVGVSGDFPLRDDWSFAIATRTLVATHIWMPHGWSSMTLISNALWAAPICAASPCGFDDLRLTTLLASLVLFSATFFLVRLNGKGTALPLLAAFLVAFNPIAYALSFTFMTDILFSALLTISALLFIASLERDSPTLAALATAAALAATFSRQLGLCVPLAYFLTRLLQTGDWRRKLVPALLPLLICAASLWLYNVWLRETGKAPPFYNKPTDFSLDPLHILRQISVNPIVALLYLGLFSLPMLLLTRRPTVVPNAHRWLSRVPLAAATGAAFVAIVAMVIRQRIMPLGHDVIVQQGIGPLALRDATVLELPNVPPLSSTFWIAVTLLSLYGMFELAYRVAIHAVNLVSTWRQKGVGPSEAPALFAAIAILAYLAPVMAITMFDRYLVPLLPLTLFFLTNVSAPASFERHRVLAAATLCLASAVFTVLAMHDYMGWNRARWAAIADLEKAGVAGPANLDGGFEYNGLFSYSPSYKPSNEKSFWWVDKDDYQIAFGPIAGLKIVREYPYETLLPPATRSILVLSKQAE